MDNGGCLDYASRVAQLQVQEDLQEKLQVLRGESLVIVTKISLHMWGQCLVPNPGVASPGDRLWEMCNGQWRLSGLRFPSCSAASARRPARETASITGRIFSALHSALAMDSVMGIELAKRHEFTVLHA